MMFLARELGKSLEEIMEISTLEMILWAAYYQLDKKEQDKRMRGNGNKYRS